MVIGVPKEIKNNEYRVGLTPDGVSAYVQAGHSVLESRVLERQLAILILSTLKLVLKFWTRPLPFGVMLK